MPQVPAGQGQEHVFQRRVVGGELAKYRSPSLQNLHEFGHDSVDVRGGEPDLAIVVSHRLHTR